MDARRGRCKHGEVIQREAAWPRGVTAKMRGTRRPAATVPAKGRVRAILRSPPPVDHLELDRRLAYKRPCASRTARSARGVPKMGAEVLPLENVKADGLVEDAKRIVRVEEEQASVLRRAEGAAGLRGQAGGRGVGGVPPLLAPRPLAPLSPFPSRARRWTGQKAHLGMSGWAASSPSSPGSAPTSGSSGSCPTLRCARGGAPRHCTPPVHMHAAACKALAAALPSCQSTYHVHGSHLASPASTPHPTAAPPPPPPPRFLPPCRRACRLLPWWCLKECRTRKTSPSFPKCTDW